MQTLSLLKYPKTQSQCCCQENTVMELQELAKPLSPKTHQLHIHHLCIITYVSQIH